MHSRMRILVGCTGSVASIKIPLLVSLFPPSYEIKVIPTEKALHFFDQNEVHCPLITDTDEWAAWSKRSDPVLHIELRNWAEALVIAPLDANTLAKIAAGLCDNLLTCVLRAWDPSKPVYVAPAMNTQMWNHVFTRQHLNVLEFVLGYKIIQPISKTLACGDVGNGAMAEPADIIKVIVPGLLE